MSLFKLKTNRICITCDAFVQRILRVISIFYSFISFPHARRSKSIKVAARLSIVADSVSLNGLRRRRSTGNGSSAEEAYSRYKFHPPKLLVVKHFDDRDHHYKTCITQDTDRYICIQLDRYSQVKAVPTLFNL